MLSVSLIQKVSLFQLRQLMAALDTDRSGTIDMDEFLKLFAETNAAKQSVA